MTTIALVIGGEDINVSPDRITTILEKNTKANENVQISCHVQQFLDFILEVQKYAIDTHVATSLDRR